MPNRCSWATDELLIAYHDHEYGRRRLGEAALFEKFCLECFQAGLSWRTVLQKREAFRRAFHNFDLAKVAAMTGDDVERLMQDASIIRNRRKIEATIHNARMAGILAQSQSLADYFYSFTSGLELSRDLKKRGFAFAGETVCCSFLHSVGVLEGHEPECFLYGTKLDLEPSSED